MKQLDDFVQAQESNVSDLQFAYDEVSCKLNESLHSLFDDMSEDTAASDEKIHLKHEINILERESQKQKLSNL